MRKRDRLIRKLVAWMVAAIYRRFEVRQPEGLTSVGPQLANASHFGGFSDPLVLIHAMDRVPRFVARDVIWRIAPARWVMNWVGAIPVHKPEDKKSRTSNDEMFRSTYEVLGEGELITIFPEGITVDDPQIAAIKTGSARIVLGARSHGVEGIQVLAAGIHYENKARLRSDVFVDIGWPIDIDENIGHYVADGEEADASNREAVTKLKADMEHALRRAAPDFEDWATARTLASASHVALRKADGSDLEVGRGDQDRLARLLGDAEDITPVVEAMDRYQDDLAAFGLSDEMFVGGMNRPAKFGRYLLQTLIIAIILLPFAMIGLAVNVVPMVLVWLIGRLKVADAVMATIKPLGAVFVFSVTWGFALYRAWDFGGAETLAAFALLLPLYLFALIAWVERVVLFLRVLRGFAKARSIGDVHEQVHAHRRAVVEAVAEAL